MDVRRGEQSPSNLEVYLRELSAIALLDRLPTAVLGIGLLGEIVYANPACADMLGYPDGRAVARLQLPKLLTGHETHSPTDCLHTLRTASVVDWNHRQDYMIRTMVSSPLLTRETDALLLIGVTDVTAWLWETNRMAGARRADGLGASRRTEVHGHSKRSEGHGPSRLTDGFGPC